MIFESCKFNSLKDCKKETKKLKNNILETFNAKKNNIALAHGTIILCGYSKHAQAWFNLTDKITDFNHWLKSENYTRYKLITPDIQIYKYTNI